MGFTRSFPPWKSYLAKILISDKMRVKMENMNAAG